MPNLQINHKKIDTSSNRYDLSRFAHYGGARVEARAFKNQFNQGKVGELIEHRIPWLVEIKHYFEDYLESGKSLKTCQSGINVLIHFFRLCDEKELQLKSSDDIKNAFFVYAESQLQRAQLKIIKKESAYDLTLSLARILTSITQDAEITIENTRLQRPSKRKKALSHEDDKQNLNETFKFGNILFDLCKGITSEKIVGRLPLRIKIRNEHIEEGEIELWGCLHSNSKYNQLFKDDFDKKLPRKDFYQKYSFLGNGNNFSLGHYYKLYLSLYKCREPNTDLTRAKRTSIFNYRVLAEYHLFVAMTKVNPSVAAQLKREKFDYKPLGEKYQIRQWKNRKGGQIEFEIPKPYRKMFEDYLEFRDKFVGKHGWLFPTYQSSGTSFSNKLSNINFKKIFTEYGLPWIPAKNLRKTGLNLLLRLTEDESLAAEVGSHSRKTFKEHYEHPSQQRANIEIVRFWSINDPLINGEPQISVFNTPCSGQPDTIENKPKEVIDSNCINPSGCLFCKHFRDIESFDYLWSLLSFKYLKIIESSTLRSQQNKAANLIIENINKRIDWFKKAEINKYTNWINEAETRIDESEFHPNWKFLIDMAENY